MTFLLGRNAIQCIFMANKKAYHYWSTWTSQLYITITPGNTVNEFRWLGPMWTHRKQGVRKAKGIRNKAKLDRKVILHTGLILEILGCLAPSLRCYNMQYLVLSLIVSSLTFYVLKLNYTTLLTENLEILNILLLEIIKEYWQEFNNMCFSLVKWKALIQFSINSWCSDVVPQMATRWSQAL